MGTGDNAHRLLNGNVWDDAAPPTATSCGGGSATVNGNDMLGSIALPGGSVTACTLNFANAWSIGPRCMFSTDGSYTWIKAISTTSITVGIGPNSGAGAIWYWCQP